MNFRLILADAIDTTTLTVKKCRHCGQPHPLKYFQTVQQKALIYDCDASKKFRRVYIGYVPCLKIPLIESKAMKERNLARFGH